MMSSAVASIAAKAAVGPLPRGQALMILSARDKTFPIECSLADAAACYSLLYGEPFNNPYVFLHEAISSLTTSRLESVELRSVDGGVYSIMYFRDKSSDAKPVRRSTSFAAEGINAALAASVPVSMSDDLFDKVIDSTIALDCLRRQVGRTWVMSPITSTDDMRALDAYLEEAMPGGSAIRA
jgi:hypothetical protein